MSKISLMGTNIKFGLNRIWPKSTRFQIQNFTQFQIFELLAVRRTQPIAIGQNLFNNPCLIDTMVEL